MPSPRVLFVSKPVTPPWNDGSKNLVRDVAAHLRVARPTVMTSRGAASLGPNVVSEPVYRDAGRFAPSVTANARVALRLVLGDPLDVWHFVFAPNPLSSNVASVARRTRRIAGWRGAVVQTIASAPRSFEGVSRWLFGDVVVALSEHTRGRLVAAGVPSDRVRVVPPCARAPRSLSDAEARAVRAKYGLGDGPVVLYPGDYEVSRGAETVARATPAIASGCPEATVVYACRKKTAAAGEAQARVERKNAALGVSNRTRHLGEIDDMGALLAIATVIVFPVDDLYGKVDLPLVLLEAMALGVPIVVAGGGPLDALAFAPKVAPGDADALAEQTLVLLQDGARRRALAEEGKNMYDACFTPAAVADAYDELYLELST